MTDQAERVPPGEGSATETRRLRRRTAERVIGGVAGGIADYLNIDPLLVRASFVGLMIFGGAGLVVYVIAWLLIPTDERDRSIVQDWFGSLTARVGSRTAVALVGLVALGVIWIAGETQPCLILLDEAGGYSTDCANRSFGWLDGLEPVTLRDAALLAIAIIVVGFVVLRWRDGQGGETRSAPVSRRLATTPATSPAIATEQPVPVTEPAFIAVPTVPRPRSPLAWYALAAAFIAVGLLAIAGAMPGLHVELGQYFGAGLAVLGLGLVVGAWWGRARFLIGLALILLPIALTASFLTVPLDGGFGEQAFHPQTVGELRPSYRLATGEIYLDLTDLSSSQPMVIDASVGVGRLVVLVPPDARLTLDARVNGGRLSLFGGRQIGTSLADRIERQPGAGPVLVLNLETGIGEVRVETGQGGG